MEKVFARKHTIILIIILIAAFVLRIYGINDSMGLSHDELFSLWVSKKSFPFEITKTLYIQDYHPVLYHYILHFWVKLFGDGDIDLRFLSVIISTFEVYVFYLLGRELKDKKTGIISALILAVSKFEISSSQYVRFYNLGELFCTLSLLFSLKVIKKDKLSNYIGLFIFNILLSYTQTIGGVFVGIELLVLAFFLCINKIKLKKLVSGGIIAFVLCLPEIFTIIHQSNMSKLTYFGYTWNWFYYASFSSVVKFLFNMYSEIYFSFGRYIPVFGVILGILGFIFASLCSIFYFFKSIKNREFAFAGTVLFLYTLILYIFSIMRISPISADKYLNMNFALIVLLIGYICSSANKKIMPLLVSVFTLSQIMANIAIDLNYHKDQIKKQGMAAPVVYLKENGFDRGVLYMSYGGKYVNKYIKNIIVSDVNFDDMFIFPIYSDKFKLIFDDDVLKYDVKTRIKYAAEYIMSPYISNAVIKDYKNTADKLKEGEFLNIVVMDGRFYEVQKLREIIQNTKEEDLMKIPLLFMLSAKINKDWVYLASLDPNLKGVEHKKIDEIWNVFVFQKVNTNE